MQREFFPLPLSPWKPQLHCWLTPFPPHAFQINIGAWLPTGCPQKMGAALWARVKPEAWGVVAEGDGGVGVLLLPCGLNSAGLIPLDTPHLPANLRPFTGSRASAGHQPSPALPPQARHREVGGCCRPQRLPVVPSCPGENQSGPVSRSLGPFSPSVPGSRPPSRNRSLHASSPARSAARGARSWASQD